MYNILNIIKTIVRRIYWVVLSHPKERSTKEKRNKTNIK